MSSTRAICVAYLNEYLHYRHTYWNSWIQQLAAILIDRPQERKQTCEEFEKHIQSANSLDEKINIIIDLGKKSRIAQAEKIKANSSITSSFLKFFSTVFDSDNSLCAKTFAAIRTCLVASILKSAEKDAYLQAIDKVKQELKSVEVKMDAYIDAKLNISELKQKRDELFNQLLDMQDYETIKEACIHERFPKELPFYDSNALKSCEQQPLFPNIPLVYQDHFYNIYYTIEIQANPTRVIEFTSQRKLALNARTKTQPDILEDNYFHHFDTFADEDNKEKNDTSLESAKFLSSHGTFSTPSTETMISVTTDGIKEENPFEPPKYQ